MSEPENPSAFPVPYDSAGMSLRDWFAGQAMSHALSATASHDGFYDYEGAACAAYQIADAMLIERQPPAPEVVAAPLRQVPPAPDACPYCDSGLPGIECPCVPF